jgi:hypothetical protein
MVAPPRTPDAITKRLSDAIAQVLRMPDVRARLAELLLEPVENTPDEIAGDNAQGLGALGPGGHRSGDHGDGPAATEPETSARLLSRGEGNAAQRRRAIGR